MLGKLNTAALGLVIAALTTPIFAEPTPGPPAWQDGASVYREMSQTASPPDKLVDSAPPAADEAPVATTAPSVPPQKIDTAVVPATHQEIMPSETATSDRYLTPPSAKRARGLTGVEADSQGHPTTNAPKRLADFGVPLKSMYTILSALAVVIGAFLVFAWLLRRGGQKMRRGGNLPADVVSVLGRVPLAARQFAELLRVGNKLVLVSLTPTGAETLTEVTDPAEVDRLLGLCQRDNPHSTTKAFEQAFRQLSSEATPSGFLGSESLPSSLASAAGSYRAYRGDAARG